MPESLHGPDRQTLRKCPVGAIIIIIPSLLGFQRETGMVENEHVSK